MISGAFHLHTYHSFDSLTRPQDIIQRAFKRNLQIVAITDHGTWAGSLQAREYANQKKYLDQLQVIIGAEYATNYGDIIGLFLKEEITTTDAFEVILNIRRQNGIAILPHPFHHHHNIEELGNAVDIIEIFNARCSIDQNQRAAQLARELCKPTIVGSDAHFLHEMDNAIIQFESILPLIPNQLQTLSRTWQIQESNPKMKIVSQLIKGLKQKNAKLILLQIYFLIQMTFLGK